MISLISSRSEVSADFLPKIKDGYVAVEDIQDSVEAVLSRGGYEGC